MEDANLEIHRENAAVLSAATGDVVKPCEETPGKIDCGVQVSAGHTTRRALDLGAHFPGD